MTDATVDSVAPAGALRRLLRRKLALFGLALIALVVAMTVEIAANPHGMGYALIVAQQSLDPALMLAWLFWIGVVGFVINASAATAAARPASSRAAATRSSTPTRSVTTAPTATTTTAAPISARPRSAATAMCR